MKHSGLPELPGPPPTLRADQALPLEAIRAWIQTVERGLDTVSLQPQREAHPAIFGGAAPRLPAACRRRTHLIDTLVEALWLRAGRRHGCTDRACAVLALGSYGRNELCPYSDIDLLILHAADLSPQTLAAGLNDFITPLWDLGLKANHVVYSLDDATRAISRLASLSPGDPTASALQKQVTSLLDARCVLAGPAATDLIAEFERSMQAGLRRHGFAFAQHKAQEIVERWSALHIRAWELPTPCYLEPNLKDGVGGLRDIQAARWIAAGLGEKSAPMDTQQIEYGLLLAARVLLHRITGRAQDRLMQGLQPEVLDRMTAQFQPERMGEEELDRRHQSMAALYAAMVGGHRRAEELRRRVAVGPRIARKPTPRQRLDREILDPNWTRVGAELHPSTGGESALRSPSALVVALQGLEYAQQAGLRPGAAWLEKLERGLQLSAPTDLTAAAAIFRRMLARPEPLYPLMVGMHFAGIVGALIREFNDISLRSQRAPLHEVTVDIHTLRVLGALENWHMAPREEDRERLALLAELQRLDILRWCALLHDIGKSRGDAGHAERGSLMAHDILTRLQVPSDDIRLVRVLIEEHLALFNLTTLDSDDRGPVDRLAARLETRAAVDLLYLLTIADAQGVAVGALPLWREDRLRAQWRTLRNRIEPGQRRGRGATASTQGAAQLRNSLLTGLNAGRTAVEPRLRKRLAAHLAAMPTRYLTRVSTAAALAHVRLIDRLGKADAAVEIIPPRAPVAVRRSAKARAAKSRPISERRKSALPPPVPIGDLTIVTRDRPGRFSQICAGLTGAGLSVIAAEVYERADGLILDQFRVMGIPELNAGVPSAEIFAHFHQTLEHAHALLLKILHDPGCAAEVMTRMLAHPLLGAHRGGEHTGAEATVHLTNASHEPLTIVDVRCPDRAGLLYGLTRAIADLGLNIHFATIDTVRGMATDVFYLSESNGKNLKDGVRRRNLRLLLKAVAETPTGSGESLGAFV